MDKIYPVWGSCMHRNGKSITLWVFHSSSQIHAIPTKLVLKLGPEEDQAWEQFDPADICMPIIRFSSLIFPDIYQSPRGEGFDLNRGSAYFNYGSMRWLYVQ